MKKFNKFGFHPFHMVLPSPWPIFMSFAIASLVMNSLLYFLKIGFVITLLVSFLSVILVCYQWWRDVIRESTFQGDHISYVRNGMYIGMVMFIASEVMFFFSFFFGYFSTSLSPDPEIGMSWPPVGITPLSFMGVPFFNTVLLLSSGVTITWCHHSMLENKKALYPAMLTVLLGIQFIYCQYVEYEESMFSMADSCYGSFFFLMTGFHGIHVIVGITMIIVAWARLWLDHFSPNHNLGFEVAAWYWHFVDVVWLFLFLSVYWWGS